MFHHVVFGVSNYEESRDFFLNALAPIGLTMLAEGPLGAEMSTDETASLCIRRKGEKTTPLHLAFIAKNREQVDDFYRAALKAGGKDNGKPGLRPEYSGKYYAAFVFSPDGHNIEVVYQEEA